MNKFLKVQYTKVNTYVVTSGKDEKKEFEYTEYIAIEPCNICKAVYWVTEYGRGPILSLYVGGGVEANENTYTGEPMLALLRWLDANSETLPGDGAAGRDDGRDAYIRRLLEIIKAARPFVKPNQFDTDHPSYFGAAVLYERMTTILDSEDAS